MALGKSGKHYNNPRYMKAMGDEPEESGEELDQKEEAGNDEESPEMMKHEVRKHEDGSYSSKSHDGEHAEHGDFHEAVHHMADKFGEKCPGCEHEPEEEGQRAQGRPNNDEDGAAASIYGG